MWASGYDYIANPKTFSLLALFSRCHTAIAQGLSKYSGPLYRSKIKVFKVHLVGTLNLCLNMPEKMQKTRNDSDHPGLRKHPKHIKNLPNSKLTIFQLLTLKYAINHIPYNCYPIFPTYPILFYDEVTPELTSQSVYQWPPLYTMGAVSYTVILQQ